MPDRRSPSDLRLAGAHNFRDLGGLPTTDGRRTRTRVLYRSDALIGLTENDVTVLHSLGIKTVVDLRASSEIGRDGHGPFVAPPIVHVNHVLFGDPDLLTVEDIARWDADLGGGYLEALEQTKDAGVAVLRLIADHGAVPLVFHCNAGKDRTGVIAAIVLGCVGVTHEAIVADYAVTAERMEPILARIRSDPTAEPVPPRLRAQPETMERFLALLDDRFGGARGWARAAGASIATLGALERVLVG